MSQEQTNNPIPLTNTNAAPAAPATTTATTVPAAPQAPQPKPSLQERRLVEFYRPEEGHRSRAVIGIATAVLALYGTHAFYEWLPQEFWQKSITKLNTLIGTEGTEFMVTPALVVAVAMAIAILFAVYKLVNYPKFVDFLIETENELKKVSWASRQQVISESIVVVATVLIVGIYVFMVDNILILVKTKIDWNAFWNKILG
jgi:preprotein translocase subunit SecE